jgi:hypothetical protein
MPKYVGLVLLLIFAHSSYARIGENLSTIKQRLGKHLNFDRNEHRATWSLGQNREVYYIVEVDENLVSIAERIEPSQGHRLSRAHINQFVSRQLEQIQSSAKDMQDLSMDTYEGGSTVPFGGQGFPVPSPGSAFLFPKLQILIVANYGKNASVEVISSKWVQQESKQGATNPEQILNF